MRLINDGFWDFGLKDMVWFAIVLSTIVWTIAVMPQKIAADMTLRFASAEKVDMVCERLDRFEIKIDKLLDMAQGRYR